MKVSGRETVEMKQKLPEKMFLSILYIDKFRVTEVFTQFLNRYGLQNEIITLNIDYVELIVMFSKVFYSS